MKKLFKIFFIIFVLALVSIYAFFYFKTYKNTLKTGFFLAFREKVTINRIEKNPIFPFSIQVKGISSENFYIGSLKYNFLTKKACLTNFIINNAFYKKIVNFTKDLNYFPIALRTINIDNLNFINNKFINLKTSILKLNILKNSIKFSGVAFINNSPLDLSGNLLFPDSVEILANFKDFIRLKTLAKIFNIEFPEELDKFNVKGNVFLKGNLEHINFQKINFSINNYKVDFVVKHTIDTYKILNGKFFFDDENFLNFSGDIQSARTYLLNFSSDDKINGEFDNITFEDLNINGNIHRDFDKREISLNITGNSASFTDYNYLKNKLQNWRVSSNISIDKLSLSSIDFSNFELLTSYDNNKLSIKKLNFNIDNGDFRFSLIHNDSGFQSAAEVKHIKIKNLLKFFNKNPLLSGLLNVTFIGEGRKNRFNSAKGYFFIEDFSLKGISPDNITSKLSNGDLINLKIFGNNDNNTTNTSFDMVKGFIQGKDNFLIFPKILAGSKNYYFNIYGKVNIENFKNIRLQGLYSTDNFSKNVILNIDISNNLIQLVPKNE